MARTRLADTSRDPHLTLRRVERQQRMVELLVGASAPVTTSRLATELRTSPRTIERDLARLRESGVPLLTRPGHGGGVTLPVRPGPRHLVLDATELAALIASLAALGPTATDAASSANHRLVAALRCEPARP